MTVLHSANTPYPSMALLFEILDTPVRFAVLEAAIELDIVGVLTQTSIVDEISEKIGVKADTTGLVSLLDAMVAIGLAIKENGTYRNSEYGKHFLCKTSPVFMGDLIRNMKAMRHKNLSRIVEIVKNGPPKLKQNEVLQSETKWKQAVAHLASYQRAGMAAICADLVEQLPEFDDVEKILDLGGGPGLIGAEILRRLPKARGVLLDLPGIISQAKREIEKEGMADRITCLAGDYNEIDLGSGYDLIWASHNLYYVKDRASFFQRVKKALSDNGVLVCLHEGLTNEQTAPASIVLSRFSLALEGQDVSFAKGELAKSIGLAGFNRIESRMLDLPAGQAELIIAKNA